MSRFICIIALEWFWSRFVNTKSQEEEFRTVVVYTASQGAQYQLEKKEKRENVRKENVCLHCTMCVRKHRLPARNPHAGRMRIPWDPQAWHTVP
jgi:hypothetical protein